jgi:PAS domain S-box-containing protein
MLHILYVDDESGLLEIGKLFLEQDGEFSVDTELSAQKALASPRIRSYDAIIADYQMPGMDGIAFLKAVREEIGEIPFILFTGRGREEVVIEAINNGADFYLQKGGDPKSQFAELAHKLRQAIGRKQAEQSLRESGTFLSDIIEQSPHPIWISDDTGTLLRMNQACRDVLRVTDEEVVGKYNILRDNILEEKGFMPLVRSVFEDGKSVNFFIEYDTSKLSALSYSSTVKLTLAANIFPIRDSRGRVTNAVIEHADITELKRAEDALRQSGEKYRRIIERMQDAYIRVDEDGIIVMVNPSAPRLYGYGSVDEMIGLPATALYLNGGTDRNEALGMLRDAGGFTDFYGDAPRKDGTTFGASINLQYVRDEEGRIRGTEAIVRDITVRKNEQEELNAAYEQITAAEEELREQYEELKKSEHALREVELKYHLLADNVHDVIWTTGTDMQFTYISPSVMALRGMTPEEAMKETFREALTPESYRTLMEHRAKGLEAWKNKGSLPENIVMDLEFRRRDGSTVWTEMAVTPVFDSKRVSVGAVGIIRDISRRRQAEQELRESQEKFRSLVENASDIHFSLTADGVTSYVSPRWTELLGHDTAEIIGKPIRHIHPEDLPRVREFVDQTLKTGEKANGIEYRILHKDGTWQWHTQSISPQRDAAGRIVGVQGICHDITRRKKIEMELRKSRQLLAEAMDIANMAGWEFDAGTGLFTFDDRFYALYKTTTEREGGSQMSAETYVREFVYPDDREIVTGAVKTVLQVTGDPRSMMLVEHRIVRRDGAIRYIVAHVGVIRDESGRPVKIFGANQDITDRKNVEKALSRANRQLSLLSSITRHDIVNKTAVILGFLHIAAMKFPDPELAEILAKIEASTRVIESEIDFTRTYQDLGAKEPLWIELDAALPRQQIPEAIALHTDVQGISVFADPMLEKVFVNLLDNSIRHGEHVTEIHVSAHRKEQDLVVVWEDDGIGIPAGEKERIFERGFGKHTGLGMFLAREILLLTEIAIRETGGPGRGARFEILVPKGVFRFLREP